MIDDPTCVYRRMSNGDGGGVRTLIGNLIS